MYWKGNTMNLKMNVKFANNYVCKFSLYLPDQVEHTVVWSCVYCQNDTLIKSSSMVIFNTKECQQAQRRI